MIRIRKGLDLPIAGAPVQVVEGARPVRFAAVLGHDYVGMRPTMAVREGDRVKRGGVLFTDKKNEGVCFTAPVAGRISSINRGAKRALLSVVIEVGEDETESFDAMNPDQIAALDRTAIVARLVDTGLWTALRTRPFSKVPARDQVPHSIFVTAMDSNPLAPDVAALINLQAEAFSIGLGVLTKLTEGPVYVCHAHAAQVPVVAGDRLAVETFAGVHPAGLAGTHIHHLDPVSASKTVWHIGAQDVIAIANTLLQGSLWNERIVALGGPGVQRPRLLRTVLGASLEELTAGELVNAEQRVISGSVFGGREAAGAEAYLGRYHQQVSVLPEDHERKLFGYLSPGPNLHSVFPIFLSAWLPRKLLHFSTTSNGSPRAMVPIGTYESVMPLDILATQLLRAVLVEDLEMAAALGCLELDEEDVALCTYACPGKYEYAPALRNVLTLIEKEG
ncbi:MAG: Na(+)-translocating NADH-quinone reductase subunit A [Gammaproteobacteria bacterium]|nr:MAG: Na(+)-translocating NADH-quinone reductase subunit A [Gammaproteobacteria bacterium]